MTRGRTVSADDEAVLSAADATAGLTAGATVRVRPGDRPLRIVGLAADANLGVIPTLYVPTSTFIALMRDQRPGALSSAARTAVAVRVATRADPAAVAGGLHRQIADVDVLTRTEAAAGYPGIAEVSHSFEIILALLGIVVAVVAGLCFMVVTVHKRPTLTLLRAVGVSARTLVACLLLQVGLVVGAGVVVGTVLAATVVGRIDAGFSVAVDAASAAGSAVAMVALALLAAGGAVRRVLRVDPAAVLREAGL
jgi:putative ABC transport system permease protein